ncbi:MAG: glycosyltransferase [Hyphomicrobiaceae bacterium]
MKVFVLRKSQNLSRSWSSAHIVEALRQSRLDAVEAAPDAPVGRGDVALVPGTGTWTLSPAVEQFLRSAGNQGAKRVVWQLEPLLPPVSSVGTERIVQNLLDVSSGRDTSPWTQAPRDWLMCQRLAWACRTEPWSHKAWSGHIFKYPLQQTRGILAHLRLGLVDRTLVSLAPRQAFLQRYDIPSAFVPFGHIPVFGRWLGEEKRDIDVLFLGRLNSRRRSLIRQVQRGLSRAGFELTVVTRDCYGEERTKLLNRTKIILNLHKFPWESPGIRLLMAMGCKALVVSEPAPDMQPYLDGQHMVVAPIPGLVETLVRYLKDDGARRSIVENAYRFATENMALGRVLSPALSAVGAEAGVQR